MRVVSAQPRQIGVPSAAPVEMSLDALHAAAQMRIQRLGLCFGGYWPLQQIHAAAKHRGVPGELQQAYDACQEVINADDAAITRMIEDRRVTPSAPSSAEVVRSMAADGAASNVRAIEASRPRVSLAEQLAALERRGFRFTVHGPDLRVAAPPGEMTAGDRGLILQHKAEIVAHMTALEEVF
jgi:hypothetical protein